MALAAWLQRQIDERGLSVRAAAMYAGLSDPTLLRILGGKRPDSETCRKLATWAEVDPDLVLALAGHRQMKPPAETTRTYPPEMLALADDILAVPEARRGPLLRALRAIIAAYREAAQVVGLRIKTEEKAS